MSLTAPDTRTDDGIVVTCGACSARQTASGHAPGYTCHRCGSEWRVLRCRGCRHASIVLDGITSCPRCGHEHQAAPRPVAARLPSWLTEPTPLSVWLGGVKYLGGHAQRDQPVPTAGLLLDRRGIHLRAFAELFTITWPTVRGMDIEGASDISERMSHSRLRALGATTWTLSVAYLTVHTADGDAVFEIEGLNPPELNARLSRVLQGIERADPSPAPIAIERTSRTPVLTAVPGGKSADADSHTPLAIDPGTSDAPLEVLVIDALWKLARLRDSGLLDELEVHTLRSRLLARVRDPGHPAPADHPVPGEGPLLHV